MNSWLGLSIGSMIVFCAAMVSADDSLTGGLWGLNDALEPSGIEVGVSATGIYQQNVHGGLGTQRSRGRLTGSYDFEMTADLERLFGWEGAEVYMLAEGAWGRRDVDATSVGSLFGVNADFQPRSALWISELWFEQSFLDDTLRIRIGKLDLPGGFEHRGCPVSFDCNAYANDENPQFLNNAGQQPDDSLPGIRLGGDCVLESDCRLVSVCRGRRWQAQMRQTGFNTAFHDEDYFIYLAETGITPKLSSANGPLQGAYRVGMWYSPEPAPTAKPPMRARPGATIPAST